MTASIFLGHAESQYLVNSACLLNELSYLGGADLVYNWLLDPKEPALVLLQLFTVFHS